MKVILYMAITANGMIATRNGKASFVTKESWDSLCRIAKKVGCVVYGRKSYDSEPIEGIPNIVLTHQTNIKSDKSEFIFMRGEPEEILKTLAVKGYQTVVLAGGGYTNASFMKENLIDEVYLDIEPLFFGKGISLFAQGNFECKLKLLEVKRLSPQTIQLHYKVIK